MSLQPKLDAFNAWAAFVAPRLVVDLAGSRFVVLGTALETNGATQRSKSRLRLHTD